MIILYEDNELRFESLGIGVLKDATSCVVKEVLKDTFELELDYPITGQFYKDIEIGRIIFAKPNPFKNAQPFRISWISKPLEGIVTIKAFHISYDMNGIIVGPISAKSIEELINSLETNALKPHNFKFKTDVQSLTTYQTTNYYNMRSLLFGSDDSILEKYKLEIDFDRFDVYLISKRGSNKGAEIRYGKNMTSLTHEISYENLYNGVYPYYHKESSQTNVSTTTNEFTKVYIVGSKPLQDGWLSFTEKGEPYHPIDASPVQVATEGEYYNKVFCWDETKQRYSEKLYDQTTTLIEGAISPEWIYIDWSGIPNLVVKANKPGYFKMSTDSEYTHHDVGDIVFKGSIRSAMSALIINYSEVIPGTSNNIEDISNSVSHTDISGEDKIVWVDTELAHNMKYNRILALDVTSDFKEDEEVNDENLKKKALEYIEKNKIGQYKYSTQVSFIDLLSTTEDTKYIKLDKIELGDTVRVVHEGLNVDVELRVVSTEYNVIEDRYESIELGEDPETISSNSVQAGDSISTLSNDRGYTTQQEVVSIVAKTITADFLKATNAQLSKAQIDELSTVRIRCTGILEASQVDVDKLVAKLLIADNAEIKNVLTAGQIKVSGDIEVKSGEINIQNEDGTKVFNVDREGNLVANSAKISGIIEATSGKIGGFTIGDISISSNMQSMSEFSETGVYIGPDGISLGKQLKIFQDGSIASTEIDLLMDPENSIQRKFTRSLEEAVRSEVNNYPCIALGSMSPTEINNDNFQNIKLNNIINISEDGILAREDTSMAPTPVKKGDNVIARADTNDNLYYEVVSSSLFIDSYRYKGDISVNNLNEITDNDQAEFGDIYRITDSGIVYTTASHTSSIQVNEGEYVIFHHLLTDQSSQNWEISKFIYKELSTDKYFGLTSDGILYANGAFISGDITVKSGEISIISEDGTKVFNVDREGNLVANSALIGPLTVNSTELSYSNNFTLYPSRSNEEGGDSYNTPTLYAKSAKINQLYIGTTLHDKQFGKFPYTRANLNTDKIDENYEGYGLYSITVVPYHQNPGRDHFYYDGLIRPQDFRNIITLYIGGPNGNNPSYQLDHNSVDGRLYNIPEHDVNSGEDFDPSYIGESTNPKITIVHHTFNTAGSEYTFTLPQYNHILAVIPFTKTTGFYNPSVGPQVSKNTRTAVYWNDASGSSAQFVAKCLDTDTVYFIVIGY